MKEPQIYRRTRNGAQPASKAAQEFWDKTQGQEFIELVGKKIRNPGYHRKFWPMLDLVVDNSDQFRTREHLRFVIMGVLNRGTWYDPVGDTPATFVPDSIAFDKMDQIEFEKLVNDFVNVILKHFLPVGRRDLEEQISRW